MREGRPQDQAPGRTYRAPSEFQVWKLERRLKRKAARLMPAGPSPGSAARVLLQYALARPLLRYHRRRLARLRRLPIAIFFYHVVTNRPVNHLCLPLHVFARQLEFLTTYHRVVSLDDAVARLASGANDEPAAVLTFDDGYKDNVWAVEYLRYYDIPAAFFVSIGHVRDGRPFDHDRRRGFEQAAPMSVEDVRRLAAGGFLVGSHAVYHEDFGALDPGTADEVLREGRDLIRDLIGRAPEHFSFPKGRRQENITAETFALAQKHFRYVHSAYGGYNFPVAGRSHFLRIPNPGSVLELALLMDGYHGFRACLGGDAWGIRTDALPPY
jgi:peptidoglycan/xylan/chitin deacetylase (PgdA/CDA1 family)